MIIYIWNTETRENFTQLIRRVVHSLPSWSAGYIFHVISLHRKNREQKSLCVSPHFDHRLALKIVCSFENRLRKSGQKIALCEFITLSTRWLIYINQIELRNHVKKNHFYKALTDYSRLEYNRNVKWMYITFFWDTHF